MRGLYLVAAELSRLGFIVSPTSRNAQGADLLVTDSNCERTFSVQVKTNSQTFNFWLMGEKNQHMRSPSFVYVFVNLRSDRTEFFVVPSDVVAGNIEVSHSYKKDKKKKSATQPDTIADVLATAKAEISSTWYEFHYEIAKRYADNWKIFNEDKAN